MCQKKIWARSNDLPAVLEFVSLSAVGFPPFGGMLSIEGYERKEGELIEMIVEGPEHLVTKFVEIFGQ